MRLLSRCPRVNSRPLRDLCDAPSVLVGVVLARLVGVLSCVQSMAVHYVCVMGLFS
jgi:hypothetical protein